MAGKPPDLSELEIRRGTPVEVALLPGVETTVELVLLQGLDDERERADLALSPFDTKFTSGAVESVAHNVGSKDVADVVVALVDGRGVERQRKSLGALAAPLDCVPRRVAFRFDGVPADAKGWSLVIDPDNKVVEIYEGNNRVELIP